MIRKFIRRSQIHIMSRISLMSGPKFRSGVIASFIVNSGRNTSKKSVEISDASWDAMFRVKFGDQQTEVASD